MLPFAITTLEMTFANFMAYYEYKHGKSAFEALMKKVINSNSFAKLNGLSISQNRPPTTKDFSVTASNLFLLGSVEKITLAAIIALWDWNVRVNRVHHLASQDTVDMICRNIIALSRLTHL